MVVSQLAFVAGFEIAQFAPSAPDRIPRGLVASLVVGALTWVALVLSARLLFRHRERDWSLVGISLPRRTVSSVLLFIPLVFVVAYIGFAISQLLGLTSTTAIDTEHRSQGYRLLIAFATIVIAHVMFTVSYVVVTVKARLEGMDRHIEEAAMDLYANELMTFRKITFPLVFPGIMAAALLSFSLSFDDFIITNLNAGQEVTFPMYVWGAAQRGVPPQINVIGTMMFFLALALVVAGEVR